MTGITLLLSTLLGKVAGLIPDLFTEYKESKEFQREKELLTLQTELQIKLATSKVEGRIAELDMEMQIEGFKQESLMLANQTKLATVQMQTVTGNKWIDGFNAVLRPVFVFAVMILFMVTAGMFVIGVMGDASTSLQQKADLIWNGSLIGMSIEAVIGFLFGYRSSNKRSAK